MAITVPTPSPVVFNPGEPIDVDKLNLVQSNIQQLTSTVGLVNSTIDGYTTKVTANNISMKITKNVVNSKSITITSTNVEQVFIQPVYPKGATSKLQLSSYYELSGQTLTIYINSTETFSDLKVNYMLVEKVA